MRRAIIAIAVLAAVFLSLAPAAREAFAQAHPPASQGAGHEGAGHEGAGHEGADHQGAGHQGQDHPAGHPPDQKDHAKQPEGSKTPPPAKPEQKKKQ